MINKWGQYAAGHNPRDDFRGRDIIGRDEQMVGGWARVKPMLLWTTDQLGAPGQYVRAAVEWKKQEKGGRTTTTEKILSATPGVSRLVKVSDRGAKESAWDDVMDEDRERAMSRLSQPEEVRSLGEERSRLNRLGDERLNPEERGRRVALNSWFATHQKLRKALEAQEQAGLKTDADRTREQMKNTTDRLSPSSVVNR
ncbi:MAG TPA: hypothetical protein VGR35_18390 [Tepidisphaeraceae bacterium]|nr:hypothetical protein [Tepidisphaeraceae bacterium]